MKQQNRIRIALLCACLMLTCACKKNEDPAPAESVVDSKLKAEDDYYYSSNESFIIPVFNNDVYDNKNFSVSIKRQDSNGNDWYYEPQSNMLGIWFYIDYNKRQYGYFTNDYTLYELKDGIKTDSSTATIYVKRGSENQIRTDSLLYIFRNRRAGLFAVNGDTSYAYNRPYNAYLPLMGDGSFRIPDTTMEGYSYPLDIDRIRTNGIIEAHHSSTREPYEIIVKKVFITEGIALDGSKRQLTVIRVYAMNMTVDYVINPVPGKRWFE